MRIFGLGPMELGLILLVVLILFGPKQLPKLGKMMGSAMKNVREGLEGVTDEDEKAEGDKLPAAQATAAPVEKPAEKVEAPVSSEEKQA